MATVINGDPQRRMLAASLTTGAMTVMLEPQVSACVQAGRSTFVAARGSRFRLMMVGGRAVIDAVSGDMLDLGKWRLAVPSSLDSDQQPSGQTESQTRPAQPQRYTIRPLGLSSHIAARARSTRQIQVLVTDENDRPAVGVPVIFLLRSDGGKSIGALITPVAPAITAKVRTDSDGIATINYRAGERIASGSITATVEGMTEGWTGQISLIRTAPGFWTPQNAIPVLATLGAALTIGVVSAATREDRLPVKLSGATVIRP
jgi:hypothetical protein